jgi:hypothetical protein
MVVLGVPLTGDTFDDVNVGAVLADDTVGAFEVAVEQVKEPSDVAK